MNLGIPARHLVELTHLRDQARGRLIGELQLSGLSNTDARTVAQKLELTGRIPPEFQPTARRRAEALLVSWFSISGLLRASKEPDGAPAPEVVP